MALSHRIARIRIEMDHTDPVLWRRVEVPLATCLKGLHDVIQAVMPFEDCHLFHFEFGDTRYGIPDPEWDHVRETLDARDFTLDVLVDRHHDRFTPPFDECGRARGPARSVKVVLRPATTFTELWNETWNIVALRQRSGRVSPRRFQGIASM